MAYKRVLSKEEAYREVIEAEFGYAPELKDVRVVMTINGDRLSFRDKDGDMVFASVGHTRDLVRRHWDEVSECAKDAFERNYGIGVRRM